MAMALKARAGNDAWCQTVTPLRFRRRLMRQQKRQQRYRNVSLERSTNRFHGSCIVFSLGVSACHSDSLTHSLTHSLTIFIFVVACFSEQHMSHSLVRSQFGYLGFVLREQHTPRPLSRSLTRSLNMSHSLAISQFRILFCVFEGT